MPSSSSTARAGTAHPGCGCRTTSACCRCPATPRSLRGSAPKPVENLREFLRQNLLSHRVWESYDDIVEACCDAWNWLMRMPDQIATITTRAWAQVKL